MTREALATASDRLLAAAEATGSRAAASRLEDLAGQLDRLAERDRGPDHGRMARIQTALGELEAEADTDEVAAMIANADEDIAGYRETVEGV